MGSGNEKQDALARIAKDRILARTSVDSSTEAGRAGYDMGRCYIGFFSPMARRCQKNCFGASRILKTNFNLPLVP